MCTSNFKEYLFETRKNFDTKPEFQMHGYFQIWNRALEIKIPDGEIRETYIKFLRDELEQTLTTRSSVSFKLLRS